MHSYPRKAMSTKVIPDLSAALTLATWCVTSRVKEHAAQAFPGAQASKAGLKEHQMIHEARSLLSKSLRCNAGGRFADDSRDSSS